MLEETIEELTKILIKEHFKNEKNKIVMTKEELIKFCIKLIKVVRRIEKDYE